MADCFISTVRSPKTEKCKNICIYIKFYFYLYICLCIIYTNIFIMRYIKLDLKNK